MVTAITLTTTATTTLMATMNPSIQYYSKLKSLLYNSNNNSWQPRFWLQQYITELMAVKQFLLNSGNSNNKDNDSNSIDKSTYTIIVESPVPHHWAYKIGKRVGKREKAKSVEIEIIIAIIIERQCGIIGVEDQKLKLLGCWNE